MNGLQPILPSTDLDRSTLDNHTNSESLVLQLTRWKGNKASHTAQTASATQSTSPSSNTRSPFNHSERSGKVLWRWTGEEEEEEESYGEVLSFITGEAQCCLEHGQRLKTLWSAYKNVPRTHQFSCPWHSRKEMIDLKWQSEDKMPFIAARVNKTHKKSTVKASAWSYKESETQLPEAKLSVLSSTYMSVLTKSFRFLSLRIVLYKTFFMALFESTAWQWKKRDERCWHATKIQTLGCCRICTWGVLVLEICVLIKENNVLVCWWMNWLWTQPG